MEDMDATTAKSLLDLFARMSMDLMNQVDSFERFGMINPDKVFAKSVAESVQYYRAVTFEKNIYPVHLVD
jgi:abortive infection bacteriophage resistance protein